MIDFKNYVIDEYRHKVDGYAAVDFKFAHTSNTRVDKKSGKVLVTNSIKVNVRFIDNACNTLLSDTLTFENNILNRASANKLHHISPKELNNKFGFARDAILNSIVDRYQHKSKEMLDKIDAINVYKGRSDNVIPTEFRGESIVIAPPKQIFEM